MVIVKLIRDKYDEKYDYFSPELVAREQKTEKWIIENVLEKAKAHNAPIHFNSRWDTIIVKKMSTERYVIECAGHKQFYRLQKKYGGI